MEIKQQFVVDGQTFNSLEDAQAYIDSNQDRRRIDAFVEHLKAAGEVQRVSKKQTDFLLQFLQYEESVREGFDLEQPGKPEDNQQTPTAETAEEPDATSQSQTSDTAVALKSGEEDPKPAPTAAEPEEPSSEPAQDAEAAAGSKHVDGPDEDLEEDPLAGLDL